MYLGRLAEAGPVTQVHHDLHGEHVVAIVGKRGSGKSYSLGTLVESLALRDGNSAIANNDCKRAVLLFDTLGIFQWVDIPVTSEDASSEVQRQFRARSGWDLPEASIDVTVWRPRGGHEPTAHQRELVIRYKDLDASDWRIFWGLIFYKTEWVNCSMTLSIR